MVWGLGINTPYLYNIGAEPLDGDFQKVDVIDRTPDGGKLPGGMTSGRPVHAEHMPTKMRWGNARYKIPDFDNSWCVNVSERAKAIIEQFEPNTHQFFSGRILQQNQTTAGNTVFPDRLQSNRQPRSRQDNDGFHT